MTNDNTINQFHSLYKKGKTLYKDGRYAAARPYLAEAAQLALELSKNASTAEMAEIYLKFVKDINGMLEKSNGVSQQKSAEPRKKFHTRIRISARDVLMMLIFNMLPLCFLIAQIVVISVARESTIGQLISGISALIAIVLSGWGCFSEIFEDFDPGIKGLSLLPRIVALIIGILSIVLVLGQYFSTCQS